MDSPVQRVFLGFKVPAEVGERLHDLKLDPQVELYPLESLHLTLLFIGEVDHSKIQKVSEVVRRVAADFSPVKVTLTGVSTVNERVRATVKPTPELMHLYSRLLISIIEEASCEVKIAPFQPHVTFGRVQETEISYHEDDFDAVGFEAKEVTLFSSHSDDRSFGVYETLENFELTGDLSVPPVKRIILPTKPQPDTICAIYIMQTYGKDHWKGVESAEIVIDQSVTAEVSEKEYLKAGDILLDIGGGFFDHHQRESITASELTARYLGVNEDETLKMMLEYARRDDLYGKGTVSDDSLDRAFGLSGLITAVAKLHPTDPEYVVKVTLPFLSAHHREQQKRVNEMPAELNEKLSSGQAQIFSVKQRKKKLTGILIQSDNPSLPGFLRSRLGGKYDVVAQRLSSGHANILTRPAKRIDLRALSVALRLMEAEKIDLVLNESMFELSRDGRLKSIPEWYYDRATNSVLNGGLQSADTPATKLSDQELLDALNIGLSETLWSPLRT